MQSRRERLRDELRREVLDAARHQLAGQHGLSKLTMAAVAKEVGVTPPALYRHFDNRQDVIAQLCVRIVEEVLELLAAAVARQEPGDTAAALLASTRVSLDWAVRNPAEFDLVIGSGIRSELTDSHDLQRRMAEMVGGTTCLSSATWRPPACRTRPTTRSAPSWPTRYAGTATPSAGRTCRSASPTSW
ncbi:TetR/AcrR family transcriptional regulator [Promicromonospora sp. Populi]|uniref:TetR/AcrR family transcriptional regulator n=1 Tax=Promicromonospora sp. Populi TaxID=3239420 RepID=UPI0034E1E6D6